MSFRFKTRYQTSPIIGVFVILLMVFVSFVHDVFGQKGDLSLVLKAPPPISNAAYQNSTPPGCTEYKLYITTGDAEGAESDAKISLTMKGRDSSLDRIEISGGPWERPDGRPRSREYDFCTVNGEPKTYVRWGRDDDTLPRNPQLFRRNTTTEVTISTTNLGGIEWIILQHDNWYPNWLVTNVRLTENGREIFNRPMNRWFRQNSLTQTIEVNPTSFKTDYNFDIKTGDVFKGETNAKVYFVLNGDGGKVHANLDLSTLIPGNPFERNQKDSFGLYNTPPMDIRSITVSVASGRWFLDSITVNESGYRNRVFRYNDWVEAGKPVTIYPVDWRWEYSRKITFRNEAGYIARMKVLYTIVDANGRSLVKDVSTPDIPVGQNSVFEIPAVAMNPIAMLIGTGTLKDDFYTNIMMGYLNDDACLKAWGTIFSPQGGTCDGSAVSTTMTNPLPTEVDRRYESAENCRRVFALYRQHGTPVDLATESKICAVQDRPDVSALCYGIRVQEISAADAVAECTLQKPYGSTPPLKKNEPPTVTPKTAANTAKNEQDCFNLVQGKVAYDTAGNKVWNESNVRNLCRGTTNPTATVDCFSSKMPQLGWAQATKDCAGAAPSGVRNPMTVPTTNRTPTPSTGINLEGDWEMYNDKGVRFDNLAKISQRGANLAINNGYGSNSTAVLTGNTFNTSDGLSGTVSADGNRIDWNVKFWWIKKSRPNTTPIVTPTPVTPSSSLGTARDIDAKNGAVWIIGTTPVPGGYGIYKFNGSGWTQIDGGGSRIAVDPSGNPWIVNAEGAIFHYSGGQWAAIPAFDNTPAADIAVARNGDVWVATTRGLVGRWNGSSWSIGRAMNANRVVALPGTDTIQAVDASGRRWTRESETSWLIAPDPTGLADGFAEFAVDSDGTRWAIDASYNLRRSGGQPIINNIVAERELRPASEITTAPAPTQRSVTFRNEAGFVAKMMIQYFESGPNGMSMPKFVSSEEIAVGQTRNLVVPASAPGTSVIVYILGTGTTNNGFFNTTLDGSFTGNRCFKSWGTLFSPQAGACQ